MANDDVKEKSKLQQVDLNALDLVNDEMEVNTEADAFAGPPPPPDGDHLAKLTLGRDKVQLGEDKQGKPYYMVHVEARLVDPSGPLDNRVVFDRASTMIMRNSGTCRIAGILRALGDSVPARIGARDLAKQFVDRLAGEPQVIISTVWEAYCSDCEKVQARGEKRFPASGDGNHRSQLECPKCGSLLTAQAKVVSYKPVAA